MIFSHMCRHTLPAPQARAALRLLLPRARISPRGWRPPAHSPVPLCDPRPSRPARPTLLQPARPRSAPSSPAACHPHNPVWQAVAPLCLDPLRPVKARKRFRMQRMLQLLRRRPLTPAAASGPGPANLLARRSPAQLRLTYRLAPNPTLLCHPRPPAAKLRRPPLLTEEVGTQPLPWRGAVGLPSAVANSRSTRRQCALGCLISGRAWGRPLGLPLLTGASRPTPCSHGRTPGTHLGLWRV